MRCHKCKGTGWILYQKEAPSPPYKKGQFHEYGARCDCTNDSQAERPGKS